MSTIFYSYPRPHEEWLHHQAPHSLKGTTGIIGYTTLTGNVTIVNRSGTCEFTSEIIVM
jgi:hypothetical protein